MLDDPIFYQMEFKVLPIIGKIRVFCPLDMHIREAFLRLGASYRRSWRGFFISRDGYEAIRDIVPTWAPDMMIEV